MFVGIETLELRQRAATRRRNARRRARRAALVAMGIRPDPPGDRHRDTPERREQVREADQRYRARSAEQ